MNDFKSTISAIAIQKSLKAHSRLTNSSLYHPSTNSETRDSFQKCTHLLLINHAITILIKRVKHLLEPLRCHFTLLHATFLEHVNHKPGYLPPVQVPIPISVILVPYLDHLVVQKPVLGSRTRGVCLSLPHSLVHFLTLDGALVLAHLL